MSGTLNKQTKNFKNETEKKTALVAFKYFLLFWFHASRQNTLRYQFNRLISKIRLKTHFVVSTLFIVSLTSFVGTRRHIHTPQHEVFGAQRVFIVSNDIKRDF